MNSRISILNHKIREKSHTLAGNSNCNMDSSSSLGQNIYDQLIVFVNIQILIQ